MKEPNLPLQVIMGWGGLIEVVIYLSGREEEKQTKWEEWSRTNTVWDRVEKGGGEEEVEIE